MKILYVITKANWGGAQKYVYELAVGAKTAGHEVAVAYGQAGELTSRLEAAGVRTIALAGMERDMGLLREWRAFFALMRVLRAERPDVLHVNSSKAGGLGALAGRLARVRRIVFTAHGWAFNEARPLWQKFIIYKLAWFTIILAHKTICVSQAICRDTRFMPFIHHKLVLIYNGVATPAYRSREEARQALWPGNVGGMWVGMLSELHPTKRVEDAIAAMREVREAKLIVLGEGGEHTKIDALIKEYGLEERVHLAGFVPEGDQYLPAFDLFLHTSCSEALGAAIIEAGLAGLPVVATEVGGIPEIVESGKTGILVPPLSPAKIASALNDLIDDLARAKTLGAALYEACRAKFDTARMLRETLALYSH